MAAIKGTAVNFGFTGTDGITITGCTGWMLQSAEQSKACDLEVVRNAAGEEVSHGFYNIHDEATLEYVIYGAGLAAAIANTTAALQTPGTMLVVTACASMTTLEGTWEVQAGCKVSGSNTTAKRLSVPVKKFANITAVAGN